MRSLRVRKSVRTLLFRTTAGFLAVVLTIALFPLPVMTSPTKGAKDLSKPFPCQDRPCGCMSAAQCKKKCCCFSAEQKIVWAKKNQLPLSDVLDAPASTQLARSGSCCETKTAAKRADISCSKKSVPHKPSRTTRVAVVIAALAQQCQGIAVTAFGLQLYILPQAIEQVPFDGPASEQFAQWKTIVLQPDLDPPVPPPRLSFV